MTRAETADEGRETRVSLRVSKVFGSVTAQWEQLMALDPTFADAFSRFLEAAYDSG